MLKLDWAGEGPSEKSSVDTEPLAFVTEQVVSIS